jgi:hypothetical protein
MNDLCGAILGSNGHKVSQERAVDQQRTQPKTLYEVFTGVPPPPVPILRQQEQPERVIRPKEPEPEPISEPIPEPVPPEPEPPTELPPAAKCFDWTDIDQDGDIIRCYCIFPKGHDGDHLRHHRIPMKFLEMYIPPEDWTDYRKAADKLDEVAARMRLEQPNG